MSYKAKGRVLFTSNKDIDSIAEASQQSFIDNDLYSANLTETLDEVGFFSGEYATIRRLATYSGFDLSDSETGFETDGSTIHTFRFDGDYDDYRVNRFVTHLVNLGMSVFGEFRGEDGAEWDYDVNNLLESKTADLSV